MYIVKAQQQDKESIVNLINAYIYDMKRQGIYQK